MKRICLNYSNAERFVTQREIDQKIEGRSSLLQSLVSRTQGESDALGWLEPDELAGEELLSRLGEKASEIREKADIFLLVGVGGSIQGSRAAIKALGGSKPEVLYAGNNLSVGYLKAVLSRMEGKSIYVNVIAKNFATLEPGAAFRIVRRSMEKRYGEREAAKRIIATGSLNNGTLERLGRQKGYMLLPFPPNVGGRFSVLTAVGLLPMAAAGINIRELLTGAGDMKELIHTLPIRKNPAVLYAVIRNLLLEKGYNIEIMAFFEPVLEFFSKWWVQLYGESEGKDSKGIFPAACSFSEDLHSLGQYIQEGQRMLFETFLNIAGPGASLKIPAEETDIDGFGYLDGSDFSILNRAAFEATVSAHVAGGVPCLVLDIPELSPYYMGQLFYFFEYACYISGMLLGVAPFDQPGVEAYKKYMLDALGGPDR